jgi:hypothetical protein
MTDYWYGWKLIGAWTLMLLSWYLVIGAGRAVVWVWEKL